MNKKLIFKVLVLAIFLSLVFGVMNFLSSSSFRKDLNGLFVSDKRRMNWCPDHVVDVVWELNSTSKIENAWLTTDAQKIATTFCSIVMEPVDIVDKDVVQFFPLLTAISAEGKKITLEWNKEKGLFKVQEISFKSTESLKKLIQP